MEPRPDEVALTEVPSRVLDDAAEAILRHTVPLIQVSDTRDGGRIERWGTGTLVRANGIPCILTAAHVWKRLKSSDAIGIAVIEGKHRFLVDPAGITEVVTLGPGSTPELGPDLVVLGLPNHAIARIEVHKVFVDVSKRREDMLEHPIPVEVGMWGVAGAPFHVASGSDQETRLYMGPYFSGIDAVAIRDGFDYFDVGANYNTNPEAPASFEGVSGGGLWRVLLIRGAEGETTWDKRPRLEGVAYYQTEVVEGRRYIRCHGTKSVYGRLLDEIARLH